MSSNKLERINMSQRCVVLTGMMGAGKTEVGEMLADQLGYEFVDTDQLIEKKENKKITDIFKEKGEEGLRDIESQVIQDLEGSKSKVISVGGGAVIRKENRILLQGLGHVVYLKASARELYYRLKNDTTRPLLQVDDPLKEFERLLEERSIPYAQSDITIDTEEIGVDEVVDKLIDEMARLTVETQDMEASEF